MTKKVKAKDIEKNWRVKKSDRASLSQARSAVKAGETFKKVDALAKSNEVLAQEIRNAVSTITYAIDKPKDPRQEPKIEVIVPQAKKVKKRFRLNIVRDQDGFMDHIDIEEV